MTPSTRSATRGGSDDEAGALQSVRRGRSDTGHAPSDTLAPGLCCDSAVWASAAWTNAPSSDLEPATSG